MDGLEYVSPTQNKSLFVLVKEEKNALVVSRPPWQVTAKVILPGWNTFAHFSTKFDTEKALFAFKSTLECSTEA
ncbi:unnamed protein product [Bathycoccus prasinos]|jgi:hypothetical protein